MCSKLSWKNATTTCFYESLVYDHLKLRKSIQDCIGNLEAVHWGSHLNGGRTVLVCLHFRMATEKKLPPSLWREVSETLTHCFPLSFLLLPCCSTMFWPWLDTTSTCLFSALTLAISLFHVLPAPFPGLPVQARPGSKVSILLPLLAAFLHAWIIHYTLPSLHGITKQGGKLAVPIFWSMLCYTLMWWYQLNSATLAWNTVYAMSSLLSIEIHLYHLVGGLHPIRSAFSRINSWKAVGPKISPWTGSQIVHQSTGQSSSSTSFWTIFCPHLLLENLHHSSFQEKQSNPCQRLLDQWFK